MPKVYAFIWNVAALAYLHVLTRISVTDVVPPTLVKFSPKVYSLAAPVLC